MMKLYTHAGSLNHGCEAIVRATINMIGEKVVLYSENPEEDYAVGLEKICVIHKQGGKRSKRNPIFVACRLLESITHNSIYKHKYVYKNVINDVHKDEVLLSVGGDNYCYNANAYFIDLNIQLTQRGAKTVLWGCSIEPENVQREEIIEDMKRYSLIVARESITYNALMTVGLKNVYLYPDPAFSLECSECELPMQFDNKEVVGINLSPLVQKLDNTGSIVLENYVQLVKFIIEKTEMNIVLIPHVCKEGNDDRKSLKKLMSIFQNEDRMVMINEDGKMDCKQLKYIISKCRYVVAARTHVSVAAYSTCVPVLVAGYSVKAKGIAKDVFGEYEKYVVDIHNLKNGYELKDSFEWLTEHSEELHNALINKMETYIPQAKKAVELLEKL